jgi:transcriptional regulator
MFAIRKKTKFPTDTQIEFWVLNRKKYSGRKIAKEKKVTPAFVSQTLREANERIDTLLRDAAKANKIQLNYVNKESGFARGKSFMLKMTVFITFSPTNGVQVWYKQQGTCVECEVYDECRTSLLQEFKERNLPVDNNTLTPTHLSDKLFDYLEEMVVDNN